MKHKQIKHTNWYEQYIDLINKGLSQRKACKEMDVPRGTIQHWLADRRVCDAMIDDHKEVVDETAYLLSSPKNAKRLMDSVTQLTKQPLNILVISDCQVKNGVDLSYLTAIGKYIASKKPDVVVNIGDFWDFPSLSSYDKGKLSFEGRRLKADIEIGNKGMDLLLAPIKQEADYFPRMLFTLGNHEERLKRVAKDNPEMSGFIDYHLLNLSAWEVHDFLKPVEVNGVWFTHYLQNQLTGKPLGGSALNMLKTVGQSFVVGHRQVLDIAVRPVLSGGLQIGVICGACYLHKEDYLGHTGNNHFRGITVLHNTLDGFGNPMFVDTKYLVENYL